MRGRPALFGGVALGVAAVTAVAIAVLLSAAPPTTLHLGDRDYRHPIELAGVDPSFNSIAEVEAGQVFAPPSAELAGVVPTVVELQTDDGRSFRYGLVGGP